MGSVAVNWPEAPRIRRDGILPPYWRVGFYRLRVSLAFGSGGLTAAVRPYIYWSYVNYWNMMSRKILFMD